MELVKFISLATLKTSTSHWYTQYERFDHNSSNDVYVTFDEVFRKKYNAPDGLRHACMLGRWKSVPCSCLTFFPSNKRNGFKLNEINEQHVVKGGEQHGVKGVTNKHIN
jgi:hypothetical protein